MVKHLALLFLSICLAVLPAEAGEISVDPMSPAYHNARYGFSIQWAPGIYRVVESDNGDGITVTDGKGLIMRAWGALEQDVFGLTPEMFFKRAKAKNVQYAKVNREQRWYVVSGLRDGNIYYRKSFYTDHAVITMDISYPAELKQQYDVFVGDAAKSFMP